MKYKKLYKGKCKFHISFDDVIFPLFCVTKLEDYYVYCDLYFMLELNTEQIVIVETLTHTKEKEKFEWNKEAHETFVW